MLFWKPFNKAIPRIYHAVSLYNRTIKGQEMYDVCQTKSEEKCYVTKIIVIFSRVKS